MAFSSEDVWLARSSFGTGSSFILMTMSYTRGAALRESFWSLVNCSGSKSSTSM